jgi:DNA-binding XRE family transcriptional regulator
MACGISLLTDRTDVAEQWQRALSAHGVETMVVPPPQLASAVLGQAGVVVDVDAIRASDEALLSTLGFIRASGSWPIVHLGPAGQTVSDIVEELCDGLVTRNADDIRRVSACLHRRLDEQRRERFAFVAVSPCGDELLTVMADGDARLHPRPVAAEDDGSKVTEIQVDEGAASATLSLTSGATVRLMADALHPQRTDDGGISEIAIDGERLGARLKELRLAAGLTQAELARRTGIHRPNIARVEAGRHTPSLETLSRIAGAIGVPTTHVLSSPAR